MLKTQTSFVRAGILLAMLLLLSGLLAACGNEESLTVASPAATTAPKTTVPTTTAPTTMGAYDTTQPPTSPATTTKPVTTLPVTTAPTATAKPATTVPATTAKPSPTATVAAGPTSVPLEQGQLLGIDYSKSESVDVRIKEVVKQKEFKTPKFPKTAKGTYVIVIMEVANVNIQSYSLNRQLALYDASGKSVGTYDSELVLNTLKEVDTDKFATERYASPGFVAPWVIAFDVPDAGLDGLKLGLESGVKSQHNPNPASFDNSGGKNDPDSGAGQELVGKTLASKKTDANFNLNITKVMRYPELVVDSALTGKDRGFKTEGVFLVVFYEVENKGSKELGKYQQIFGVKDSKGRIFGPTGTLVLGDLEPDKELKKAGAPINSEPVKPGEKVLKYAIFEIPRNSADLSVLN